MKVKTSELSGKALDWAVASSEGASDLFYDTVASYWMKLNGKDITFSKGWSQSYLPSTDWSLGGAIIEREKIRLDPRENEWQANSWNQMTLNFETSFGPTPLVAAMRRYVASKLGQEVDVPVGLTKDIQPSEKQESLSEKLIEKINRINQLERQTEQSLNDLKSFVVEELHSLVIEGKLKSDIVKDIPEAIMSLPSFADYIENQFLRWNGLADSDDVRALRESLTEVVMSEDLNEHLTTEKQVKKEVNRSLDR